MMYEEKDNIIAIKTKKKYIPIKVYKCFVKMAMAVIPEHKLRYFNKTIEWLNDQITLSKNEYKQLDMWQTKWPVRNIYPTISIDVYQRKLDRINIPFMFARVCFKNYAFQFTIPFCSMDLLVHDFNIPVIIKNEYPYKELLSNSALWRDILHSTVIKKMDLSNSDIIEEKYEEYYSSSEINEVKTFEDLPENIKKYIKDKGLKFK